MFASERLWSRNASLNHLTQAKREMCQDRENISAEVNSLRSVLTPLTGIYSRTKKAHITNSADSSISRWTLNWKKAWLTSEPRGRCIAEVSGQKHSALYRAVQRNQATAPCARGYNTHGKLEKDIIPNSRDSLLPKPRILLKSLYFQSYDGFRSFRQGGVDRDIWGNKHQETEPDSTGSLLAQCSTKYSFDILKSQSWFNITFPVPKKRKHSKTSVYISIIEEMLIPTGCSTTFNRYAKNAS